MKTKQIEILRHTSRQLVRELGMLQLNKINAEETPGYWHALIEISKEPGITIAKLSHLLLISNSTMSRLIKTLAKDGLLKFKIGQDKREKYLYLSSVGQDEIKKIDNFSHTKIAGAFEFLQAAEIAQIIKSISKYSAALEKSRLFKEQVQIATLSTSRTIRKQIVDMITNIQKKEFSLPITSEINDCVLKAEQDFYYNNSYNFWYAMNKDGKIIGSIGLKMVNKKYGELKKFFVIPEYRGKEVAQKLIRVLLKAAVKHNFDFIVLGTVDKLQAARKFYKKSGFAPIKKKDLPTKFKACPLDTLFFKGDVDELVGGFA